MTPEPIRSLARGARWVAALALVAACSSDDGGDDATVDAGADPDATATDDAGDTSTDTVDDTATDAAGDATSGCIETAGGALPDDVEWIVLDGNSDQLLSFHMRPLNDAVATDTGLVLDLNAVEVFGGNGFKLDGPADVVGAEVRWANLPSDPAPVELTAWPDFSSDGFAFDVENPLGTYTRCLDSSSEGEWVSYAFDAPIPVEQPLHVFVGYHRDEVQQDEDGWVYDAPELLFENWQPEEEPYHAGIRWPAWEPERFYGGQVSPWYTWQVRLAVVPRDRIAESERGFEAREGFRAGSRVAWGDYDNDGDDDLMTNGPRLYRNDDGELVDVTETAFAAGLSGGSGGGVWGDYDNDGCLDYFGQGRRDLLLHNACDGTFVDVTDASGISDLQGDRDCDGDGVDEPSPTEGAGWADVDGDGFIDLYLANYECSSEFDFYQNYRDRLFCNQGDGTFVDCGDEVGISDAHHAGRGVTVADYDADGDTDIFVSNYRLDPNFFYENDGRGGLEDVAREAGVQGVEISGAFGHTIGSVFGDIDLDGDLDLVQANLAHPFYYQFSDLSGVFVQDRGVFVDEGAQRGLYYRETASNPTLFDADNDGDLDLFVTNVYRGRDSDFYENDGTGHFTLRNYESGLVVQNGWGGAAADVDSDGDMDLVAYELFENHGADGHWVQVRAVGVGTNVSAIGAIVEVEAGGVTTLQPVGGASGTSSQDSFTRHFGLGDTTTVDAIRVRFPYGDVVEVTDVDADQRVWIYSDGEVGYGLAPPR